MKEFNVSIELISNKFVTKKIEASNENEAYNICRDLLEMKIIEVEKDKVTLLIPSNKILYIEIPKEG